MSAAAAEADPSQHWFGADGAAFLPSRWVELEQTKSTIDNDADPSGGRCLGIRCLTWDRSAVPLNMTHNAFGGRFHTMSKASLLLGAQGYKGGMPVLKHLPVKMSEFLHTVHGDKFSSLGLPPRGSGPLYLQMDQLFGRIEFVDNDDSVILQHGGVFLGHKEYEGSQQVYAWSFPDQRFREFNHQDPVL